MSSKSRIRKFPSHHVCHCTIFFFWFTTSDQNAVILRATKLVMKMNTLPNFVGLVFDNDLNEIDWLSSVLWNIGVKVIVNWRSSQYLFYSRSIGHRIKSVRYFWIIIRNLLKGTFTVFNLKKIVSHPLLFSYSNFSLNQKALLKCEWNALLSSLV